MRERDTWIGVRLSGERFEIRRRLGQGGMGVVFQAWDHTLETDVVVKVPHLQLVTDGEFTRRFQREVRALVRLTHPHIVKVLDVGEHDGTPFAVMHFLGGGSLENRMGKAGMNPGAGPELTDWLEDVAAALDFIHRQGYVHRDIKPANILFDDDGNAYVSDFGIAKVLSENDAGGQTALTGTGMLIGTMEYMAPEALTGSAVGPAADQYSLACTVYETLAGDVPFTGNTPVAIFLSHSKPLPPLQGRISDVSPALEAVVFKGLAREVGDRYPTCTAFAEAVAAAVGVRQLAPLVAAGSGAQIAKPADLDNLPATLLKPSTLICPQCSAKLRAREEHAGKKIRCPTCQLRLRVAGDLSRVIRLGAEPSPPSSSPSLAPTAEFPLKTAQHPIPVLTPAQAAETSPASDAPKRIAPPAAEILPQSFATSAMLRRTRQAPSKIEPWMIYAGGSALGGVLLLSLLIWWVWPKGDAPSPIDKKSGDPNVARDDDTSPSAMGELTEGQPYENGLRMKFSWCPPGNFRMGSPAEEPGRFNNESQVTARFTKGYWIGRNEVTQQQWQAVMGTEPWKGTGKQTAKQIAAGRDTGEGPLFPANNMSWHDADAFCDKLTESERRAGRLKKEWKYALPTEAQWEYACRAGTTTPHSFGADVARSPEYSWSDYGLSIKREFAHRVGQKQPNAWNLYDMHGNVWEWCRDGFSERYIGGDDPEVTGDGNSRVMRGGAWNTEPRRTRSANRGWNSPDYKYVNVGLRVTLCAAASR